MTLIEYRDLEQRSEEWLALRCGMITASVVGQLVTTKAKTAVDFDCPACQSMPGFPCLSKRTSAPIATHHPERTAVAKTDESRPDLVLSDNDTVRELAKFLTAERVAGIDPDGALSGRDIWRGIDAEEPAREKYAEHYRVDVDQCGFMVREEPGFRVGFSPDGLVGDEGFIEIKSPRRKGHVGTVVGGVVPALHVAQIQTGFFVSGRNWCDFVSISPGMRLWVKRIIPDPEWQRAIAAAVTAFELTVEQMVSDYLTAVEGFPMTSLLPDPFEVELKL